MIFELGDNVLLSNRRMFERDEARFFIGEVIYCDGPLVKLEGYSFVKDLANGHVVKKEERRIKVISLNSPGYFVYQLPSDVEIDHVEIDSANSDAILTDGFRSIMNLAERTHCGHF